MILRAGMVRGKATYSPKALFAAGQKGVWYDPSDLSSMFQDTAGTTPVTAAGQAVARINDKSGNGLYASQGTVAARPTYQVDGAGRGYLSFDGVDDSLSTATLDLTGTDKATIFVGATKLSDATNKMLYEHSVSTDTTTGFALLLGTAAPIFSARAKGVDAVGYYRWGTNTGAFTFLIVHSLDLAGVGAAGKSALRMNNAVISPSLAGGAVGVGPFGNHSLFIGRRNNASFPHGGALYGFIVRGAASSAAEITAAESWLNARTGAF